jgi:pimeloyl-ACP methyl ester carboxylesterase
MSSTCLKVLEEVILFMEMSRMRNSIIIIVALLWCGVSLPCHAAQQPLEGDWVGGFMFDGTWAAVNVRFRTEQNGINGAADIAIPSRENAAGAALTAISIKSSRLYFEIPRDSGKIVFDGQLKEHTIVGTYQYAGSSGVLGLTRSVTITLDVKSKLYGAYRIAPNKVISIGDTPDGGNSLWYIDYGSGQVRILWASSENTFFAGTARAVSYPVTLKVTFIKDAQDNVTKLLWEPVGERAKTAVKIPFKEEKMSFKNGDITFGGTLISPPTNSPHPVVILVPGAFRTTRDLLRLWGHNFVRRGIAVFIYDARGTGVSTGTVGAGSFSDFANDALAAVQLLKTRANVNPKQIGLFGFSNSAWTVTLAASRSKDVAFLITQSMSGVPPWQQEIFRAESQLRADGFPVNEVDQGAAFMRLKFEAARTGQGWEGLQAIMADSRNARWLSYTNPPRSLERLQQSWQTQFSYDPVPSFENVTCPVLAYFGEVDTNVPVRESVTVIERSLRLAGNKDYTIKVFPKGRHDLVEGENGGTRESALRSRYVPRLWDTMTDWVLKRVSISK